MSRDLDNSIDLPGESLYSELCVGRSFVVELECQQVWPAETALKVVGARREYRRFPLSQQPGQGTGRMVGRSAREARLADVPRQVGPEAGEQLAN